MGGSVHQLPSFRVLQLRAAAACLGEEQALSVASPGTPAGQQRDAPSRATEERAHGRPPGRARALSPGDTQTFRSPRGPGRREGPQPTPGLSSDSATARRTSNPDLNRPERPAPGSAGRQRSGPRERPRPPLRDTPPGRGGWRGPRYAGDRHAATTPRGGRLGRGPGRTSVREKSGPGPGREDPPPRRGPAHLRTRPPHLRSPRLGLTPSL